MRRLEPPNRSPRRQFALRWGAHRGVFDGLNRRIEKEVAAGSVDTHYYLNTSWQMLEERQVNGEGTTIESNDYVWSARYIDSPIVRFHDGLRKRDITNIDGSWRRW